MMARRLVIFVLITTFLIGCASASTETVSTPVPIPSTATPQASPTPERIDYEFPESIDPSQRYMFYLHGKILEDQGLPAISPEYGEYEYEAILDTLSEHGFVVISEQRPKDADSFAYAKRVRKQVQTLIEEDVPAENITVVGASKGAAITVLVSHLLENDEVNLVLLGACHPDTVDEFMQDQVRLVGNVLSIYDSVDKWAGSCQELFAFSEGQGLASYDEIVLEIGTGHGILYQPLDAWITPTVRWAKTTD